MRVTCLENSPLVNSRYAGDNMSLDLRDLHSNSGF
jgi:hypothetical protein